MEGVDTRRLDNRGLGPGVSPLCVAVTKWLLGRVGSSRLRAVSDVGKESAEQSTKVPRET